MQLPEKVVNFLRRQGFVIVSTIDPEGSIHCAAKGLVGVYSDGRVFVIDLYCNKTYKNLQADSRVSITQVDEHSFSGYTLSGKARIVLKEDIKDDHLKEWERAVLKRISDRLIKGVQSTKTSGTHHEAKLPEEPKYLIEIVVEKIVDLSPPSHKELEK